MKLILLVMIFNFSVTALATESKQKTQKIDFEEEMIDGQVRKPDGSYVVQKRSVDFVPLYRVREHFDENIKQSIEYLK